MEKKDGAAVVYARNRKEWRKWLQKHHASEKKVWLVIYHKKSETPSVYYDEAVEEALCYGWIDSKPGKRDEESYYLSFSPRKPRSVWSKVNKGRVDKLIADGSMTTSGLVAIEIAKGNGSWEALNPIDELEFPDDFTRALTKNKSAARNFNAFPPSSKKIILGWILSAKRPETREKRIQETISLAAENVRANHYTPKGG